MRLILVASLRAYIERHEQEPGQFCRSAAAGPVSQLRAADGSVSLAS